MTKKVKIRESKNITDDLFKQHIRDILRSIGEEPDREGLTKTPDRVLKAWKDEVFSGYQVNFGQIRDMLTQFEEYCNEMILLKNVEFYSTCEHHMMPFVGQAHIAYLPGKRVVGVSKLARLLEVYSRRLQIQERIGIQVTHALDDILSTQGSACILEARHFCMCSRGVNKQNSIMVTSSLTGAFKSDPATRSELFSLIKD